MASIKNDSLSFGCHPLQQMSPCSRKQFSLPPRFIGMAADGLQSYRADFSLITGPNLPQTIYYGAN